MAGNKSSCLKLLLGGVDIVICWWREDRSLSLIRDNDCSARHRQITIFCEPSSIIVMLVLVCNLLGKCRAGRHLFCFLKDGVQTRHAHKQSTVCNAHEWTIVRRQLSAVTLSAYHLYRKLEKISVRIQIERFISLEIFHIKGTPYEVLGFSHFYRNDRKFLYPCVNYQC